MEELRRFFRLLVRNLAATDPGKLRSPLRLGEVRDTILPYRTHRRALQLESSEDYELVLIRLCAGQGGYAQTKPADVHAEFAAEALNSNPDLTVVVRHPDAALVLNQEHLAQALDSEPSLAFAPREERFSRPAENINQPSAAEKKSARGTKSKHPSAANCRACGGKLPGGVTVKFCPHCGEDQAPAHCPDCETELERTWRHCVGCGRAVGVK